MELELGTIVEHTEIDCNLIVVYMDDDYEQFVAVNMSNKIVAVIGYNGNIIHKYDLSQVFVIDNIKPEMKIVDKLNAFSDFDKK